mmetsp:Transcript_43693/g.103132  ORF Transcript_43693/g.103132 Transcript_43693/m.103132 type:complete len:333 (+) Transcript_43693:140-1138(+)
MAAVKRVWSKFREGWHGRWEAGSAYLADLTHTRQRLVLKHQDRFYKIGAMIGNCGYFVGGLEYGVTDMMALRVCAGIGAGMVVFYQLCQPRVQWLTAGWNVVFAVLNCYHGVLLRADRNPNLELSWEEKDFHRLFESHISSLRHLDSMLKLGDFQWLVDGATLTEQGLPGEQAQVHFITVGTCEVVVDGQVVKTVGPGDVVGEMALLCNREHSSATVVAVGSVRCYSVPSVSLKSALDNDKELKAAIEGLFLEGMANKVAALNEQVRVLNYKGVLEVACQLHECAEDVLAMVSIYRMRHRISDSLHSELVHDLPQCVKHAGGLVVEGHVAQA